MGKIENLSFSEDQYFAEFRYTGEKDYDKYKRVSVVMWVVKNIHGDVVRGYTIEEFRDYMIKLSKNRSIVVWFHNLNIPFSFIEHHFLYKKVVMFKKKLPKRYLETTFGREYTTIRNYANELFGAEWFTANKSSVSFRDSSKIFPTSLESISRSLKYKGDIYEHDTKQYYGRFYAPSDHEWSLLENNTDIIRLAMIKQFERYKSVKMTRSAYAFDALKLRYNMDNQPEDWEPTREYPTYFDKVFPKTSPEVYEQLRPAYAGGIVYVNPKYKGKKLGRGMTYDVNSLYPYVMSDRLYPHGDNVEFKGSYYSLPAAWRDKYPLYVQSFHATFTLKDGGFPSLPKKLSANKDNIYSSDDLHGFGTMALTNIDMEHFLINYDIEEISFIGGYMWEAVEAPFKDHVEDMYKERSECKKSGDKMDEVMVKYDMNSSYGKFGQSPFASIRSPYINFEKSVQFETEAEEPKAKNYLPMAIFITAYARDVLLKAIYSIGLDRLIYVDTDSLHITGWEDHGHIEISQTELGKWKLEGKWEEGKFLHDKQYIHRYEDEAGSYLVIKASGISDEAKAKIKSVDGFALGKELLGNKVSKQVQGGYLITDMAKTLGMDVDKIDIVANNDQYIIKEK